MDDLTDAGYFLAGVFSSFMNISIAHPLYTIRTRVILRLPINPRTIYHGYRANLTCDQTYQAVLFSVFGIIKNWLGRDLTAEERGQVGMIAGISAAAGLTSLERVMIIQQHRAEATGHPFLESYNMTKTYKEIIAKEGLRTALTRGLIPTMLREATCGACFFGISRWVNPKIERCVMGSDSSSPTVSQQRSITLLSYLTSGLIAGSITTPFDLIKTRLQVIIDPKKVPLLPLARDLLIEYTSSRAGLIALMKAAAARSIMLGGSMMILGTAAESIVPSMLPATFHRSVNNLESLNS